MTAQCADCEIHGVIVDNWLDGRIVDNDLLATYADPTEVLLMISTDGQVRCGDCDEETE